MRIALYGALLVAAVAVIAMRPESRESQRATAGPPQLQLGGRTDEGLPARAITGAAGIRFLRVRWRMTCASNDAPTPSSIGFSNGFERRDGGFWVGGEQHRTFGDGWSLQYHADVRGTIATDGRSASGRGSLVEHWYRNGQLVDRCHSRDVNWRVGVTPRSI